MEYNREELVRLLEAVLARDNIGVDWDDLALHLNSKDDFARYWARKIIAVEELYPSSKRTELFNPDGLRYLKALLDELLSLGATVKAGGGVIPKVLPD
ncbi:MAG: hypothetical protein JJ884_07040 [Maricaulis sp.]|uniref:hypothetical protein n=1 Tax=Maricaulis sp. TaxID=1486257 RepID=UPI001B083386|nr:hypothetical protein [Maricaulis sp.]MBO6730019.1 hypothetical protein [Maricaulis sp.]MBO6847258.1 hypothetical protein [Maricaulis sp.]MBO6876543.1 hypothetical protein [Maricaulis sp.]